MTSYNYERGFRIKIIASMLDNLWMAKFGSIIILPEYFEPDDEIKVVKSILHYREAYGYSPRDVQDLIALAGVEYSDLIYKVADAKECGDYRLAADKAIEFAKEQAAKLAILEGVDDIAKGNLCKAIDRMKEALKVGDNLLSAGLDPVADSDKWLFIIGAGKVPTGQYHLDLALEGGLEAGELGIILAPPNVGKSMELINIGYGGAGLLGGKNVVHFTHEMKPAQVAKRYAARMVHKFPQQEENLSEYQDDLYSQARKLMKGQIRIIGGQKMTTAEFESHMDRLIDEGFNPGLIIDDYIDLMTPPRQYNDRRFELSALYEWARATGDKYNCPFWSASQGNRGSFNKEIITMADFAEDIGKAAISDVVVALCQTWEESQAGQCRLFITKLRDAAKSHPLIGCKFYGSSQAIVTIGYVQRKGEDKETDA
jgi:replicative DNA helicase